MAIHAMATTAKGRHVQLVDGDILECPHDSQFFFQCCDCSLIHAVQVTIVGTKARNARARLQLKRDSRRTSQRRRREAEKKNA